MNRSQKIIQIRRFRGWDPSRMQDLVESFRNQVSKVKKVLWASSCGHFFWAIEFQSQCCILLLYISIYIYITFIYIYVYLFIYIYIYVLLLPHKTTQKSYTKKPHKKIAKTIEARFPRGGQKPKIQYYDLTCSGVGEKETLNINVVGKI